MGGLWNYCLSIRQVQMVVCLLKLKVILCFCFLLYVYILCSQQSVCPLWRWKWFYAYAVYSSHQHCTPRLPLADVGFYMKCWLSALLIIEVHYVLNIRLTHPTIYGFRIFKFLKLHLSKKITNSKASCIVLFIKIKEKLRAALRAANGYLH